MLQHPQGRPRGPIKLLRRPHAHEATATSKPARASSGSGGTARARAHVFGGGATHGGRHPDTWAGPRPVTTQKRYFCNCTYSPKVTGGSKIW